MYVCSECEAPAEVDHVNPPVKSCSCEGTIHAALAGSAAGSGGLVATTENHNLSVEGQLLTKSYLIMLAGREFFTNDKRDVYVKAQRVTDEHTGRTIVFDIVGREA
jgi:hypothetical protein